MKEIAAWVFTIVMVAYLLMSLPWTLSGLVIGGTLVFLFGR